MTSLTPLQFSTLNCAVTCGFISDCCGLRQFCKNCVSKCIILKCAPDPQDSWMQWFPLNLKNNTTKAKDNHKENKNAFFY